MKRSIITKILFILVTIFSFGFVISQNVYARETRSLQVTTLDPTPGEVKNFYTIYGENVEIKGEVNGDVYAVGGQVDVTGKINGDLLAIAQDIKVSGVVTGSVRSISQSLKVSGKVNKNLTVITETLDVDVNGWIGGGIGSLSGSLNTFGPVVGQITAGAKDISFDNSVGGPSELWVESLAFGPKAVIEQKVNYHSDKEASVDASASVAGTLTRVPLPQVREEKAYSKMSGVPFKVIGFIGSLIIGLIVLKFFPKFVKKVVSELDVAPLNSGLIGLALMILLPIVSFVLLITLVGAPLSVFGIILYLSALYFAKIFASVWIGKKLLPNKSGALSFGVGLLLYYVVAVIPFVGGLVSLISKLVLMGTLYTIFKADLVHKSSGK